MRSHPDVPGGERIVLASASPRRAELLTAAGIQFDILPSDVDESVRTGEPARDYVVRVAEAKARAAHAVTATRTVIAADTAVVAGGTILGKPLDAGDARRMLRLLSGRVHEVLTAVSVMPADGTLDTRVESTQVEFAPLSVAEIEWYVASGEPMDKAGAYAVQGLASRFVVRISGSYSNVVGLPIALVYQMLRRRG